ncbi:MAG: hypothetical protein VX589_13530 [Myxococcota bacterium]|nr:hypothetical protein [Myxococcota bacterium]
MSVSCLPDEPAGIGVIEARPTTVKMDFLAKPLPDIPLPNDIATRYDARSATGRRINASMLAPTRLERSVRTRIDEIDGWGINQPITIPFSGPIDVQSILKGHRPADGPDYYDLSDDVVYLIDIDRDSPEFGEKKYLDLGQGNFPYVLEDQNPYTVYDPRGWTLSLLFEEADEDINGNGKLDEGDDTDYEGVLDKPNYLPGLTPAIDDIKGRAAALMTFYEAETNTLIARPMTPLRERTTYAVVVTSRIKDLDGRPVGSPYPYINHLSDNEALAPLPEVLGPELSMADVAFAWTFTTQTIEGGWVAVREGLYGHGVQSHLGRDYPAELNIAELRNPEDLPADSRAETDYPGVNKHILYTENVIGIFDEIGDQLFSLDRESATFKELIEGLSYVDYHVIGSYRSPQLFERAYSERPARTCSEVCDHMKTCATLRNRDYRVTDCMDECEGQGRTDEDDAVMGWNHAQRACRYDRCGGFEACMDEDPWLPFEEQAWPEDLDRVPVQARSEDVYFWLAVPRKEVSVRKAGKPAPIVMVGHGYTLNRVDTMVAFAGALARTGNAVIAIDCPSHGPVITEEDAEKYSVLGQAFGVASLVKPLLATRAKDQNGDGKIDSGADFWTSYLFHTRDVVRQCTLDHMQLIRILRSFDGKRRDADRTGDGEPELAGDFDGDGVVDVGGDAPIAITGTSLGGIIASTVAGVEPNLDVSAPIAGGGVLTEIGARSFQAGVMEAVVLRLFSSVFTGALKEGKLELGVVLPNLNQMQCIPYSSADRGNLNTPAGNTKCAASEDSLPLAVVDDVMPGDTVMAVNLDNDEHDCGLVTPEGRVQVQLPSDLGDRVALSFFRGVQTCLCDEDCTPKKEAKPFAEVTTFGNDVLFQGHVFKAGDPLVALAEGLGLARATPSFRRFLGIGQLVLDPADPASLAPHYKDRPLKFPAVGDETNTHTMVVTTMGDMNVPASSGLSVARAAGFVDFLGPTLVDGQDKYAGTQYEGMSQNEILLKTGTAEAVHLLRDELGDGVLVDNDGQPVPIHIDIEDFSGGQDRFDHDTLPKAQRLGVERLDPPLRAWHAYEDGGISGAMFLFVNPTGKHGFELPGDERKWFTDTCRRNCDEGLDPEINACVDVCTVGLDACETCMESASSDGCEPDCAAYTEACKDVASDDESQSECSATFCDNQCRSTCQSTCDDRAKTVFDGGYFMSSVLGKYFASRGRSFETAFCESTRSCDGQLELPPPPDLRQ